MRFFCINKKKSGPKVHAKFFWNVLNTLNPELTKIMYKAATDASKFAAAKVYEKSK